jgi:uncharacterized membrane protein YfcA
MTAWEAVAILLAGVGAGTINAVVGSGTLITFPTLLAFGLPPVTANVSNTIGLVPGAISGVVGYRRELAGQRSRALRLSAASLTGAALGAVLLLVLPKNAFEAIVPVLIVAGLVLVITQPRISGWVARRHSATGGVPYHGTWWVWPGVWATGVYGGYFGAGQGVLLMAVLGTGFNETLQRLNGVKNILGATANAVSGLIFVFVADVDWRIVLMIGAGSLVGGHLGATVGRKLPTQGLRITIVVVGTVALAVFLLG